MINYVNLSEKFDTNGSMIIIRFYVIKPEELFRNGNSNLDNPFLDLFDSFIFKKIIAALSFCHYLSFDTCNQFFFKKLPLIHKSVYFSSFFLSAYFSYKLIISIPKRIINTNISIRIRNCTIFIKKSPPNFCSLRNQFLKNKEDKDMSHN